MNYVKKLINELTITDIGMPLSRVGNINDGGYVVIPELLRSASCLYSYGIGNDIGFELGFREKNQLADIFCIDPTIDSLPPNSAGLIFKKEDFCLYKHPIMNNSILKIDVEGNEFLGIKENYYDSELMLFQQLIIEFHFWNVPATRDDLSPYFNHVYNDFYNGINHKLFFTYYNTLRRLNKFFYIYHIHPNNSLRPIEVMGHKLPPLLEVSFVRKDLVEVAGEKSPIIIGHSFDAPNKTDRDDITGWYPLC